MIRYYRSSIALLYLILSNYDITNRCEAISETIVDEEGDHEEEAGVQNSAVPLQKRVNKDLFLNEILASHNKFRDFHASPHLQLNEQLNAKSQEHANYLLSIKKLEHSGAEGVGENLYSTTRINDPNYILNGNEPVAAWYSEIFNYDYRNPKKNQENFHAIGHFTQLVWKSTTDVGCAAVISAENNKNTYYVVCQYKPPGNVEGQYEKNVPEVLNEHKRGVYDQQLSGGSIVETTATLVFGCVIIISALN